MTEHNISEYLSAHRKMGRVNWIGVFTLIKREVGRFVKVYSQTIIAPVVTTLLFYTVFALAFGGVARQVGDVPFLQFLAPGLIMMTVEWPGVGKLKKIIPLSQLVIRHRKSVMMWKNYTYM